MQFGDRLVLLRYEAKDIVNAFAEAQIVGITLDHDVAKEVGERLKAEGKAEFQEPSGGSSMMVVRECGSYMISGGWIVTCPLADVMEIAIETAKAKGISLFVMVNAELTSIYQSPTYLQPAPKFTRGFIKPIDQSHITVSPIETVTEPLIIAVRDYKKASRLNAVN